MEPPGPMFWRGWTSQRVGEQGFDRGNGERDEPGIGGRGLAWGHRRRGSPVGAVPQFGRGDRADSQSGHDQDQMPQNRGVQAGLARVKAEAVLGERERFLNRPSQPRGTDQVGLGD
jgi:hypothetical protein